MPPPAATDDARQTQDDAQHDAQDDAQHDAQDDARDAQAGTGADEGAPFDRERAMATIREQRAAERKLKHELRELTARLASIEDAQLSETERLKRDHAALLDAHTNAQADLRRLRAQSALAEAGAIYPDLVADRLPAKALEDRAALRDALATMKRAYPSLFRAARGAADGTDTGRPIAGDDMNALLRASLSGRH